MGKTGRSAFLPVPSVLSPGGIATRSLMHLLTTLLLFAIVLWVSKMQSSLTYRVRCFGGGLFWGESLKGWVTKYEV